jgi:hypothetical protein
MDEDERLELRETTLRPLDVLPHRTGAERLVNTGVLKGRQDLAQMGAAPFRGGGYDSSGAWRSGDPALVGVAKVLEGKGIAVG